MTVTKLDTLFEQSLQQSDLSTKQQAVLRASLELFATQGFARTSTSDIAQAAGVSEGTVYKKFKTKDDLLQALLQPFAAKIIPQAATKFVANPMSEVPARFETLLQRIFRDRLQFALNNSRLIKILLSEAMQGTAVGQQIATRMQQVIVQRLVPLIAHYQEAGQLVAWPPLTIVQLIVGTEAGQLLGPLITQQAITDPEAQVRRAVHFLMKGLAPEPSK